MGSQLLCERCKGQRFRIEKSLVSIDLVVLVCLTCKNERIIVVPQKVL